MILLILVNNNQKEVCDGPLNGNHAWEQMHARAQEVCIDYVFKMGGDFFQEYPAFLKALVNGDVRMALAQSNRHFRGADGRSYTLTKRHEALKGLMIEITGQPLRLGKESGKFDKRQTGNPIPAKLHWNTLSRPLLLSQNSAATLNQTSAAKLNSFTYSSQLVRFNLKQLRVWYHIVLS